jgi:hypothetical protein
VRDSLLSISDQASALYLTLGTLPSDTLKALLAALPDGSGKSILDALDALSASITGAAQNAAMGVTISTKGPSKERGLARRIANLLEAHQLPVSAEVNDLLVFITAIILEDYGVQKDVRGLVRRALANS